MAKYIPGPAFSEIRGKEGGIIFSRNRYGLYTRPRAVPVNPNSVSQQGLRQLLGDLSTQWKGLTDAQRADWDHLASEVELTNNLGLPYNPSGVNLFISLQMRRVWMMGFSVAAVAPAQVEFPQFSITAAEVHTAGGPTFAATLAVLETDPATPGADATFRWLVRATGPRSGGKEFVGRSDFRLLTRGALDTNFAANAAIDAATNLDDIWEVWASIFGPSAQVGERIEIEVALLSAFGWLSPPVRASVLVTPEPGP